MITDQVLSENKRFITSMVSSRVPKPKIKKKFGQSEYKEEMITALTSGQCGLIEIILKAHGKDPYLTAEEVLGDLQIVACEVMNNIKMTASNQRHRPYTVEDFMEYGRFVKKSGIKEESAIEERRVFCDACDAETRCSCVCDK